MTHESRRYMSRFSCLGGACEDTCCQGWEVTITAADLVRVRKVLPLVDRVRFDAVVVPTVPAIADRAATICYGPDGRCSLLDGDGLCSLHRAHGEDAIPALCRAYPRRVVQVGARTELTASLGCPEAVRLALLAPDGMDPAEVADTGPPTATIALPPPLLARVQNLRRRADAALSAPGPLRDRLRAVLALGGPTPAAAAPPALRPVLLALGGPDAEDVLRSYLAPGEDEVRPSAVLPAYLDRRAEVEAVFGDRADQILGAWCRWWWSRAWDVILRGPALAARVQVLTAACLRFLLLGHPEAVAAARAGDAAAFDALAVRIIYRWHRAVDQSTAHARLLAVAQGEVDALGVVAV